MLSEYGVQDIRALGGRRLRSLVLNLPPGCALHRAQDPVGWSWTQDTELLASVIEVVDVGNRMYWEAHRRKGSRRPAPAQIERPWERVRRAQSERDRLREFVEFGRDEEGTTGEVIVEGNP